jgi:exopolysaccharide biosynthesis polyprenyl glycosylphosphotransferase
MIRRHITALRLAMMAADGFSAVGLFILVSMVRFGPDWLMAWDEAGLDVRLAAFVYAGVWVATLWLTDMYRLRARWTYRRELVDVARAALLVSLAAFSALFVFHLPDVSRLFLLGLFSVQVVVTIALRVAVRSALRMVRAKGYSARFILVIGTGDAARSFIARLERRPELGLRVVGFLAADDESNDARSHPVLGAISDIESVLHSYVVDEVAICLPAAAISLIEPVTRLCEEEGKIVRIPLESASGLTLTGGRLEDFDGLAVLSLVYGPDRVVALVVKRVVDIVGSALGLILLSPVFIVAGALVLADEGPPILFHQIRVGLHGRTFRVLKFRTMVRDAEDQLDDLAALNEIQGPAFKLAQDPRISRAGRFLRRTSLDELPQLWNVLTGSMSLVGPRPPLPREVAGYDLWHRRRLSMKPGITGLWQVSARRDTDFDRWVALDLDYIERWSLWLDLKIMLRTIPALLSGR